ncbi:hypothetical protein MKX03_013804, partial [Papaver bracteatum]
IEEVEKVEKELVARAVDAAKNVLRSVQSSYDVAVVGTGVDVNKEKSLEQETEEDARSTTSTIESDHTEEEYPSENDDFDDFYDKVEEDEKMEESKQVATSPSPPPVKKEIDEEVQSM